jgi:integrase
MASVIKRIWTSRGLNGRKVKKVAWGYTLQVKGKQERKFSGEWTSEQAEQELAARILQLTAEDPRTPRTLAQVATEYLDFKRAKGKRSLENDETFIERFKAFFGADILVADITAQQIARYDSHRLTQASRLGRAISPASVNRELACLRHLLRLAEEWGYIAKTPRIRMAKEPEGRLRFLGEDEAARLLAACRDSKNPHLTAIVTTALHTGMRRGEILGLTWDRVDFSRGVLLVDKTKSGRRREVPMNRAVYDALSGLPAEPRDGLLFHRGGGAWGAIRTAFESACTRAKLHDFRFHDLRHTCASWLVMRGRSLKEVQELLGHQTFAMTLRYAHLSPDRLREAVASLDRPSERPASAHGQHKVIESGANAT